MKSKNIVEIPFNQWTRQMLMTHFGIRRKNKSVLLEEWTNATDELSDFEKQTLQFYRFRAKKAIYDWKEADLRDNFLSPIVSLVDFHSSELVFSSFSESSLQAQAKNIVLKGKIEWMAAMGFNQPVTPFFFIHEYKSEAPKGTFDGRGQLLAMMLAAQILNTQQPLKYKPLPWVKLNKAIPIYGSYIIGVNWYFIVLQGKGYCMSNPYIATNEANLFQIFRILKAQKRMIMDKIKAFSVEEENTI